MIIAVGIQQFGGCEYVRAFVPMTELRRRGHHVAFVDKMTNSVFTEGGYPPGTLLAQTLDGDVMALDGDRTPDIFYCQRLDSRGSLDTIKQLQSRGTRIVYDLDDNFHSMPSHNPNAADHGTGKEKTKVKDAFVEMCDLFTVSTPDMAQEYARVRGDRPMAICYNAIEDRRFEHFAPATPYDGAPKREGQIRIGWAGSGTHAGDLRMILPALCSIMDEFPQVQLVFVGADLRHLFGDRYYRRELAGGWIKRAFKNRVEYAGESYPGGEFKLTDLVDDKVAPLAFQQLIADADFDIAIAPIESNTFNRAKSYVKALEYGMLSLPMVLSNFGPYREFAQSHGGGGACLLADGKAGWVAQLRSLIESQERRARLADHARHYIERYHRISTVGDQWERAFQSIMDPVPA